MHDDARIARKLSVLADLGLERVEVSPVQTAAARIDKNTYKVTCGRPAMGTFISVTALHPSRDLVENAIGRAFEEMDRRIAVFNRFDGASAVSLLNREGRLVGGPPELSRVVGRALHYHRMSHGSFDMTVKPLVDLFSQAHGIGAAAGPGQQEVAEVLELVGSHHVELSPHAIRFRRQGVGITLDGIAKGYIVDRVAEDLTAAGLLNYLINAGGDIRTAGCKEAGQPWTVAVQDPEKAGDYPDVIPMGSGAVATSGSYEIYFDHERMYHHIINSRTGTSPDLNASVSVVAPTTMAADALATSAFVMDPEYAIRFIEALPQCECLLVDQRGVQWKTRGWDGGAVVR
jgi:thiamine biosynthesis lipoprotein